MNFQLNPRQFYGTGIACFLIIGLASAFSLIIHIKVLDVFSIISGVFGTVFDFAMVFFFNYLLGTTPKETIEEASDDINEILEKVKDKDEKKKSGKK